MKKKLISLFLVIIFILSACQPSTPTVVAVQPLSGLPQGTDGYPWWNDTVFYEVFVRSFYDSNGDGKGDLNGITAKLDYFKDLGITGLWLMPIYPSPSYHGYDITDYYSVNPDYGSLNDIKNLITEAHKRGIRIILDMVLNHTSSQNPWFVAAQDPNSPYRNYYIWSDTDPGYNGPWGEKVWYKTSSGYYYAIFDQGMPDLNYKNPDVTAKMEDVTKFWLQQVGVDGFRLDAVRHLIEEGQKQANTDSTHTWLQSYFTFYKNINPNALTVGELAGEDPGVMAAYVSKKQLDLAFDFNLAAAFVNSAKNGNALDAAGQSMLSYKLLPALQNATFLTNHDQDRLMDQLGNNADKVKVAAALLLTSPGVPFVYYGEEVGLEGQQEDPNKRAPMQWTAGAYAGFSTTIPWESIDLDYKTYNVATETSDPNSIYNQYRNLIHIRNEHAALRVGDFSLPTTSQSGLYAELRVSKQEAVLVLINLTAKPITSYKLGLSKSSLAAGTYHALPILGSGTYTDLNVVTNGAFSVYIPIAGIPAYGTIILQLQKTAR